MSLQQVYVYADWDTLPSPQLVGVLEANYTRNKEHFSFNYDDNWLGSPYARQIDPGLHLYSGRQHSPNSRNFRAFLDSCPDRWGRLLMKRREAIIASREGRRPRVLRDVDYLLGVHDDHRQGALRFKRHPDEAFLDDNPQLATPPLSKLSELEHAAASVESNRTDDPDYLKWLQMLMSPGSSLGGARPKASVIDGERLWIAKFPSRFDEYDVAVWEYLTHLLALDAGIDMAPCQLKRFQSPYHTFMTQRFDRTVNGRLHFTSAMTQLGYYDGDDGASYLELANFLTQEGSNTKQDLAQLWRRIVFYIAVSNTDDHLRNHGFIYSGKGWRLAPAYDINPTTPAEGLSLFITENDNRLDYQLAFDVAGFFRLSVKEAKAIYDDVVMAVATWPDKAKQLNISRQEQQLMQTAFNI